MFSKDPKDTEKHYWTEHVKFKMRFYGLSAQRVLRVIKRPKRKEEGIVKNTIAVMIPISSKIVNGKENWKQEVWVMYQIKKQEERSKNKAASLINNQLKIISAWRYPGMSPKRNPIPEGILAEIENIV